MRGRRVSVVALLGVALLFLVASAEGAPGALDARFGVSGVVTTEFQDSAGAGALVLQSGGKIVAAGTSAQMSGFGAFTLVRYEQNGSLDASFGSGGIVKTPIGTGDDSVYAVAVQEDGKIVVAGTSDTPTEVFTLARYNASGSLDTSFGSGGIVQTTVGTGNSYLYAMALQSDGKIIAAGSASNGIQSDVFTLARYNSNGSLDTGFGSGGIVMTPIGTSANAIAVAVQGDGKIVAAGNSFNGSGSVFTLARYNSDGSPDAGFGSGGIVTAPFAGAAAARGLLLQPDGKIVGVGDAYNGASDEFALARYNSNGSLDTGFGSSGIVMTPIGSTAAAPAGALQPDGKIVAGGYSTNGPTGSFALARYNPNGSLDPTLGGDGIVTTTVGISSVADALALQPDGKMILAGGAVFFAGGKQELALARYLGSTLTVQKLGTGAGTVTSSPAGINCGTTCSAPFAAVPVTLAATPAAGSIFNGWSGGGCVGTGTCRVQMSNDQTVTATFSLIPETLTITKVGTGTVTSSPAGIRCGATCSHAYAYGTTVTLTAKPASGSVFKGWSGACSGTGTCRLTMKQAQAARSKFAPKPCIVPRVKGESLKVARRRIKRAHCRTGTIRRRYSTVKNGHVITQRPRARRHLRNGAKVNLVISKGRRP